MSLEIGKGLNPEEERPASFRGNRTETDQDAYCQSILPWDEIAQKWPKERFPSLLSMDHPLDQRR
ncbi:MAG: hypothetical protein ABSA04_02300 [Desulfobaccales bacterium]|jgi:hypothetical protein